MKKQLILPSLLVVSLLVGIGACAPSERTGTGIPRGGVGAATEPPRVLIFTRDHTFDGEAEFWQMFEDLLGAENITRAVTPRDMDLLAPGLEERYDAVVFYDQNNAAVTQEQLDNFHALMYDVGMPAMVLHLALASYANWTPYRDMAGGRFIFGTVAHLYEDLHGRSWGPTRYAHEVNMNIRIEDRNHPITRGLEDFVLFDEAYLDLYISPDVHVLLTTDFPEATREIAWINRFGNSPIFSFTSGHDQNAFNNENFRKLIRQGIDWLISEGQR